MPSFPPARTDSSLGTRTSRFLWLTQALLLASVLGMTSGQAQPTVEWVTVAGSLASEWPQDMALSPTGETLVVVTDRTWPATGPETVLYKFDLKGTHTGSQASRGEDIQGVAVDSKGNYYLTGRVWDSERLGMGVVNDFYLAKYSSTGTLLWERATGSPGTDIKYETRGGSRISFDKAGNVLVAGYSSGPAAFGNVTFPSETGGPLICKYDPAGGLLWAKRVEVRSTGFSGTGIGGIALDGEENIVICGYLYNGNVDFGGTSVKIAGPYGSDSFIAKFDRDGRPTWIRLGYAAGGVAVDRKGNIYFNCGKLNPAGEVEWVKRISGAYPGNVALDFRGEPVFTMTGRDKWKWDEIAFNNSDGGGSLVILKATSSGAFQWAITDQGDAMPDFRLIRSDGAGNHYVTGALSCDYPNGVETCGSSTLGSFPLVTQFGGQRDIFLTRLSEPVPVTVELKIARTASGLALSWPTAQNGFVLESTEALPAASWSAVPGTPSVVGDQSVVTVEAGGGAKFYRLRKP